MRGEGGVKTPLDSRGGGLTFDTNETSSKICGKGHQVSLGISTAKTQFKIAKRSFRRLTKKLHASGFAIYHGTIHLGAPHAIGCAATWSSQPARRRPRPSVLSWNCAALSSGDYAGSGGLHSMALT